MIQEITYQDPALIFSLFAEQNGAIFLDSAQRMENCGRYSFIAIDPFLILCSQQGRVMLQNKKIVGHPLDVLAKEIAKFTQKNIPDLPPFQGGVIGFFSYELAWCLEKLPIIKNAMQEFPDFVVGFYDLVIGFDLVLQRAWIFSNGYPEKTKYARKQRASQRINWLLQQLLSVPDKLPAVKNFCKEKNIQSNFISQL